MLSLSLNSGGIMIANNREDLKMLMRNKDITVKQIASELKLSYPYSVKLFRRISWQSKRWDAMMRITMVKRYLKSKYHININY